VKEVFDELPQGLHLVDLPQPMAGFTRFISSWFFVDPQGRRILVDPGPANTIPMLLEKLSSLTDGLDLILLTHIHLDHAGGVAELCDAYGNAKVLAHEKGQRHLANPEKLWKASLDTLGDTAATYGEPAPLAPEKLLAYDDKELSGVAVMETPGHAPHHLCFTVRLAGERLFFAGEAAGMRLPTESGAMHLRPTAPGKFDAAAALQSLDKIAAALQGGEILCYAHWGIERDAKAQIAAAKEQVGYWLDTVSGMEGQTPARIADYLLLNDRFMAGYSELPEDIRLRERLAIENSIEGFLRYLQDSRGK